MKAVLWFSAAVLVGLALFEVTMQPSPNERVELLLIFLAMAVLAAVAAIALLRWASLSTSIRVTLVVLALASFLIVAGALVVAANQMFLSRHDLTLTLVVLGFGIVAGLGFAVAVARPMTADLRQMADTADRVAHGDLTAETGVRRRDEVGRLAESLDAMTRKLATAEAQRQHDETSRRQFFAAVGHDLRSPLASLQAALEALQDGVAPDPDRYLASMERDLTTLRALVDDLFLLARIESGTYPMEPVPVDVSELADEALDTLRPVANREGVRLRLNATGSVVVPAGPEALGRVLRNLVDNAIRHAPHNSEVVVEVRNGTGATVTVVDDGPGFDPGFVDAAFERFTRADPARSRDTGGSGLGLAIAQGFVAALGGEIWAEPGPGGRVGFRLPPADRQGSTRTPRQKAT